MKVLAIDSSGMAATIAVVSEECMIGEYTTNYKKTHSQTLLPMVDKLLDFLGMELSDMDAFAISEGPGSFTGLRIGAATVKGFCLALDKPLIAVPTLEALAYNMATTKSIICPIIDARRNQVFTGLYKCENGDIVTVSEQKAVDILDIIEEINELGKDVVFVGDGVNSFADTIKENIKVSYELAPVHMREQKAGAVGALALRYYEQGKVVDSDKFEPEYMRISQAERERNEKLKES